MAGKIERHYSCYTVILGEAIKFVSGLNHLGDQETKLMNQPNRHFIQNRAIQKLIDFRVLTEYQMLETLFSEMTFTYWSS